MLKNYGSYLLLFAMVIAASACCKRREYCGSGSLKVAFAGFSRSEVRLLELKRFKTGDHSVALDSATLSYTGNVASVPNKKDTLWLDDYTANGTTISNKIVWGNDWQIRLINAQRKYIFTLIGDEGNRYDMVKCGDNSTTCTNELSQFAINDNWNLGNTIYIQR